jgi:hypothetical protein
MQSLARTLTLGSLLAILVPTKSLTAQAPDRVIGTWKLNVAKSKYHPGPAPKSNTVTFEAAGNGVKVSTSGVNAQGQPTATSYTANYDGKYYPVTGSLDYDSLALKRVNASTVRITRKKAGKVVQTATRTISKDGKTYKITTTGRNAKGQRINDVVVMEKQ